MLAMFEKNITPAVTSVLWVIANMMIPSVIRIRLRKVTALTSDRDKFSWNQVFI